MEVLIILRIITRVIAVIAIVAIIAIVAVTTITTIAIVISISIQLQAEAATLDRYVLFLENRVHCFPCLVISNSPSFRVHISEIITEVQLEFLFCFIVTIDLDVINVSVIWHLCIIPS